MLENKKGQKLKKYIFEFYFDEKYFFGILSTPSDQAFIDNYFRNHYHFKLQIIVKHVFF